MRTRLLVQATTPDGEVLDPVLGGRALCRQIGIASSTLAGALKSGEAIRHGRFEGWVFEVVGRVGLPPRARRVRWTPPSAWRPPEGSGLPAEGKVFDTGRELRETLGIGATVWKEWNMLDRWIPGRRSPWCGHRFRALD